MSKFRKCLMWFCMLTKRLFHQWSFLLILCMIPLVIPVANIAMNEDSGAFRVAILSEDNGEKAKNIIRSLKRRDSVIEFCEVSSREEALRAVVSQKTDAAWIINDNFERNLFQHVNGESSGAVFDIIEREETIITKISREIMFGAIYGDLSYAIYKDFSVDVIVPGKDISEDEFRTYFTTQQAFGDVIVPKKLNTNKKVESDVNFLTAPLRGILSLIVLLCAVAAAIYHLGDRERGKYDWLSHKERIVPAFASCLSAACVSAVAVFIALQLSDISTGFFNEIVPMLLYIAMVTGFALVLCAVFRSPGKLGAIVPGLMIASLALSPIFFDITALKPISMLLPTYYYLYSVYDAGYYLYALIYCVAVYGLAFVLNLLLSKHKENNKII